MNRFATLAATAMTALGVALAPLPAAADANSDDLARLILGITAVGVAAKLTENRNEKNQVTRTATNFGRLGSADRYDYDGRVIDGRIEPWRDGGPKAGRGYKKNPLPQVCLRNLATGRRDRAVYSAQCLRETFRFANKLPNQCALRVEGPRGRRTAVYDASCLARDGWVVTTRAWGRERDRDFRHDSDRAHDSDRDRRRRSLD